MKSTMSQHAYTQINEYICDKQDDLIQGLMGTKIVPIITSINKHKKIIIAK